MTEQVKSVALKPLPSHWPTDNRTKVIRMPQFGVVAVHPDRPSVRYDFAKQSWVEIGKVNVKLGPPTREDNTNGKDQTEE